MNLYSCILLVVFVIISRCTDSWTSSLFHALGKCAEFVCKCAVRVNVGVYLRWHRPLPFYETSVYLFEQHISTDIVYWFLFGTTTLFGRLFQPLSDRNTGSQRKIKKKRERSVRTNCRYKIRLLQNFWLLWKFFIHQLMHKWFVFKKL